MIDSNDVNQIFPNDATGEVLRDLQRHGVDFSRLHDIEFFLAFTNEEDAKRCAAAVDRLKQYKTRVLSNNDTGTIDVLATRTMRLRHGDITAAEEQLAALAEAHNGVSDGWGTLQD